MTQDELKLVLEALEDPLAPTKRLKAITAIKEVLAKEKALQALHAENERLGLYKDAYAEQEQEPNIQASIRRTSMGGLVGQVLWIDDKLAEGDYNLHATPPQRTEQEPVCPDCKAKVLYECVACSSNNYPPKTEQEPVAKVVCNSAGQISMQTLDGNSFDISKYVGSMFYTTPPQQEPVAYLCEPDENGLYGLPLTEKTCTKCFPVYRHPQRTWVGLTDEQIDAACKAGKIYRIDFIRAYQAAHGIKENT